MFQPKFAAYPSERSVNGSEDKKSNQCARPAVPGSSIARAARGRRGTQRLASGAFVPRGGREVDPELHPGAAVDHGGDAHRADARADLADRVQRRLRRRLQLQSRLQAALRDVAAAVPEESRLAVPLRERSARRGKTPGPSLARAGEGLRWPKLPPCPPRASRPRTGHWSLRPMDRRTR